MNSLLSTITLIIFTQTMILIVCINFQPAFLVVTVQFSSESYEVNENGGSVQPTIVLDEALDCCSFSLVIKVEDLTRGK